MKRAEPVNRAHGFALLAALLVAGCAGSDQCQADCATRLAVSLDPALSAPGEYTIEFGRAGAPRPCTVTLPLEVDPLCPGFSAGNHFEGIVHTVSMDAAPAVVELRVTQGGRVLISEVLTPKYRESDICGHHCRTAFVSVAWTPE